MGASGPRSRNRQGCPCRLQVSKTKSSGEVFREAVAINQSLSALLDVIKALSKKKIVVFRQNLLTLYLKDSLINSYFALICCCAPGAADLDETICTLSFGSMYVARAAQGPWGGGLWWRMPPPPTCARTPRATQTLTTHGPHPLRVGPYYS